MLASFWNVTNLANYGTILGGIAVITGALAIFWRMLMKHLKSELTPVKQLERNGGSSVADIVHEIRATQRHIHTQLDQMQEAAVNDRRELHEHIGWHKGQGHVG